MKPVWALGLLTVGAAFIVAACGGGAGPTSTATPPGGLTPTPTIEPSPTPSSTPDATATPTVPGGNGGTGTLYSWEISTVDDSDAAKPSLALDAEGIPHIAYMLEAMPGFVKHAVLGSSGWEISQVSTGYFYGPLDIQVDNKGVPHISWHNHDSEDGAYASLVDGAWVGSIITHPGHDGWDINLAIDSLGRPHTASIDPVQFGGQSGVEYATFNGELWEVEEVGSGPVPYEFGTAIALDSQDRPHVAWFDASDKELRYAVKDGGSWNISTVDGEGDVGRFPFLALDTQGNPAITYYEKTGDSQGYIKLARWDGSRWNTQRIDSLEKVVTGHFGARKNSSLVLDEADNPIVAYSDEQVIKLAWWDGSRWNLETVLTAEDPPLGQQVSLARDNSGVLHMTFADVANPAPTGVAGRIKYARGTPKALASGTQASTAAGGSTQSESTANPVVVDLDAVPMVDLSVHGVPLDEVVFDTFNGSFARLSGASEQLIRTLRDAIKPIYHPGYGDDKGLSWLKDSDLVIGFESEGGAYAYPVDVLNLRELVNDVIDGVPVLVSYCPLCGSGVVYSRDIEGTTLLFGNTSALFESDLVMYDHQTGSYWFQVLGEAIVGEMTGQRLVPLPSMTVGWGEWKRLHPDTMLLVSDGKSSFDTRFGPGSFGSGSYAQRLDASDFPFPVSQEKLDGRLRASELVVTAEVASAFKAYPVRMIGDAAVNDEVGGQPVVVFSREFTGSAFLATVSGRRLTFQIEDGLFVDRETGSTWNEAGRSVAGPLEGARLEPVASRRAFWFSIAGAIPGIDLYLP